MIIADKIVKAKTNVNHTKEMHFMLSKIAFERIMRLLRHPSNL